jgi:hypothetical protein
MRTRQGSQAIQDAADARADQGDGMSGPSERRKAWRNMLVAGLNEALRLGRITLDPKNEPDETPFDFTLAGLPARGFVRSISYGEVSVEVFVNYKTILVPRWLLVPLRPGATAFTYDAWANGWLERLTGKWLQCSGGRPLCRSRIK